MCSGWFTARDPLQSIVRTLLHHYDYLFASAKLRVGADPRQHSAYRVFECSEREVNRYDPSQYQ